MEFLIRHKSIVTFIFCTLFCIISLSVQGSGFTLTFEGIISGIFSPFQKGYNAMQGGTSRFWAGFSELDRVRDDLKLTRAKLETYEGLDEDLNEIRNENLRLRSLLGMKERLRYESIPAFVISKDPDNWFRTVIINRGSNDGITVNMPVVAYQGETKAVIGKIVEVRGSLSRIQPVISPDVRIGVKVGESKYPGLLTGYAFNSNLCKVDYITRAAQIKFGDPIVTSGQAGVFPPGFVIGTVVKTELPESSPYQKIIVRPVIDYNLIEEVFIIKKNPDKDLFELFEEMQ
ncbi:MAG TPA: rod shape-determining protein MreC [Spirochaetota bacterium]|nr:rod shape-determining protein MreC [Spirochaetota bacterium]HPJ33957.1 rod shape-determining protein MreC [Spirochaetota bacterium]